MWKRIAAALLAVTLLTVVSPAASAEDAPGVSAASAIVMHSGGEVVYEKNADEKSLIASTTKIMTALVTLENAGLEEKVLIPEECALVEGSSMYLRPGEQYSVRDLLTGLMLASGNDAATALALHIAGSEEAFAALMNQKAEELGLNSSHFVNPHGLNAEGHYSTARDLARLMDVCMRDERFAALAGMESATVRDQTYVNHNRLLSLCPGCIGGKTGYTMLAGRCLVSCCEREGTRFICVTLSDPDDWDDHMALYDWAFSTYADREVTEGVRCQIPVVSGTARTVEARPEPLSLFLPKAAELRLEIERPFFVFAPVTEGERAGSVRVLRDGELIAETELLYAGSIDSGVPTLNGAFDP